MPIKYYRTFDQIENLKLKITVEKVSTKHTSILNVFSDEPNEVKLKSSSMEVEWQEKVFSPPEVIKYLNYDSSNSELNQQYHKKVESLGSKKQSKAKKIVSEIADVDNHHKFKKKEVPLHERLRSSCKIDLKKKVEELKFQTPTKNNYKNDTRLDEKYVSKYPIHNKQPLLDNSFIEFNLMIYFPEIQVGQKDLFSEEQEQEVRLCQIKYYPAGLISINPGICSEINKLEHYSGSYTFKMAICSENLTTFDEQKEWEIYEEFFKRYPMMKKVFLRNFFLRKNLISSKIIGNEFNYLAEKYLKKINLFGEIELVKILDPEFECEHLYVRYSLELPEEWEIQNEYVANSKECKITNTAISQRCKPLYNELSGCLEANFGFPLELSLVSKTNAVGSQYPKIYFQVYSVDSWDRHVLQGYGFLDLPKSPSSETITVRTWRPNNTPAEELRSYFVGGSKEFNDLSFIDIPREFETYNFDIVAYTNLGFIAILALTFTKCKNTNAFTGIFGNGQLRAISDALQRARSRLEILRSQKMQEKEQENKI
ncbi:Pleiotropic negative transcriptional regulator [Clydaea vesicula]|uniref:Pleiotropic negative transcriptional regulator n=1 Tax=Clydaea vesicula TaxID=447962 RepID=A0AAD5U629_9FUNG|nr:Pleiotropic negative transcriptional regulator [Clydaea vesicula]